MQASYFDPRQRSRDKDAARQSDDAALSSGRITAEALSRRNFAFGHLDFSAARMTIGKADGPL